MIWRDDDVGTATRYSHLARVNDALQRFGQAHTIAVVVKGIEARRDLIDLILERGMIVQLHCWTHDDLTTDAPALANLGRAVTTLATLFGRRPTVLYPPWNRTNSVVDARAAELGLEVSAKKVSLTQFIRCAGDVAESTINFHHWHQPDRDLLEPALIADENHRLLSARRAV